MNFWYVLAYLKGIQHVGVFQVILWLWLQEVKKRYKYCLFSHTNRTFRVLGDQCVLTFMNL